MIRVAISPRLAAIIFLNGRSSNSPPGASVTTEAAVEKSLSATKGSADLKRRAPSEVDPERVAEDREAEGVMVRRTTTVRALLQLPRPADRRRARLAAERIIIVFGTVSYNYCAVLGTGGVDMEVPIHLLVIALAHVLGSVCKKASAVSIFSKIQDSLD